MSVLPIENTRHTIGKTEAGFFVGPDLEETQFVGLPSIFFSQFGALTRYPLEHVVSERIKAEQIIHNQRELNAKRRKENHGRPPKYGELHIAPYVPTVPEHVFVGLIAEHFWTDDDPRSVFQMAGALPPDQRANYKLKCLFEILRPILAAGLKVTVECREEDSTFAGFTYLRQNYRGLFILLICLCLPQPDLGGFSVKVCPPVTFPPVEGAVHSTNERVVEDHETGCGVYVMNGDLAELTEWDKYEIDTDGSLCSDMLLPPLSEK